MMVRMYVVPGLHLIPQSKLMSCWYASAQMLIQWRRNISKMTLAANPDPSQLQQTVGWKDTDRGVTNPQVVELAKSLGLAAVPPQTITLGGIERLLRAHGPLWTNGQSHIVVIGGVDSARGRVQVYDPLPVNVGKIEWRRYQWYLSGGAMDSRDTGLDVQAIFLYHPS